MNRKIRWGYMGAGRIAGWFATGMSVLEDAELYAIASRTLEKGKKFAKEWIIWIPLCQSMKVAGLRTYPADLALKEG